MTARMARLVAIAAGVLALAGCQNVPASSPDRRAAGAEFVRHPDGIEVPPPLAPGMDRTPRDLMLVPAGDCVLGVNNSDLAIAPDGQQLQASTNWVGAPGCSRLVLSPKPPAAGDPQPSGALRVHAAVPAANGAVLGIGSYPAGPAEDATLGEAPILLRREPDGSVRELARLPRHSFRYPDPDSPNIWPFTTASDLVHMGPTLFVAGADVVDGRVIPVIWTSADGGATLTALPLPAAPADQPRTGLDQTRTPVPARIATDGQTLLATAGHPDQDQRLWIWRSADGGRTWQVSAASAPPGRAVNPIGRPLGVVRVHGRWLVFGSDESRPTVLSSPDGAEWGLEDTSAMGMGWVTGVTVDQRGDLAVLGEFPGTWRGSGKGARPDACGVVWSGRLGSLRRQELGCIDARVKISAFSSIATIADGRVLIANGDDLWIRE